MAIASITDNGPKIANAVQMTWSTVHESATTFSNLDFSCFRIGVLALYVPSVETIEKSRYRTYRIMECGKCLPNSQARHKSPFPRIEAARLPVYPSNPSDHMVAEVKGASADESDECNEGNVMAVTKVAHGKGNDCIEVEAIAHNLDRHL